MAEDIKIPREIEPVWPNCCVRCGGPDVQSPVRLRWSLWSSWGHSGKAYEVHVPACYICASSIRHERARNALLLWGGAAAGVAIVMVIEAKFYQLGRPWRKLAMGAGLVLGSLPGLLWMMWLHPPAIDVDVSRRFVTFSFRSSAFAEAFGKLNAGAARDV